MTSRHITTHHDTRSGNRSVLSKEKWSVADDLRFEDVERLGEDLGDVGHLAPRGEKQPMAPWQIMATFFHVWSVFPLIFRWRNECSDMRRNAKKCSALWNSEKSGARSWQSWQSWRWRWQVLDDCRQLLKDEDWFARKVAVETVAKVWPGPCGTMFRCISMCCFKNLFQYVLTIFDMQFLSTVPRCSDTINYIIITLHDNTEDQDALALSQEDFKTLSHHRWFCHYVRFPRKVMRRSCHCCTRPWRCEGSKRVQEGPRGPKRNLNASRHIRRIAIIHGSIISSASAASAASATSACSPRMMTSSCGRHPEWYRGTMAVATWHGISIENYRDV